MRPSWQMQITVQRLKISQYIYEHNDAQEIQRTMEWNRNPASLKSMSKQSKDPEVTSEN